MNGEGDVSAVEPAEVVIRPSRGWVSLGLSEVWSFRGLLYFLAWRDVLVRYKQTVLGAAWAILQPLFTMTVFFFIFGRLAKIPSDNAPYPIFAFTALVPWTFFANGVNHASQSLVGESHLIKKVYFPRLVVPVSAMMVGSLDMLLSFGVLGLMMAWYGLAPGWAALWLPLLILLAVVTALGVGLWLSALNVQFRDVRHVVPFLLQAWMYLTPIAYPASVLPERVRRIFAVNPMTGVVEGFRWALLGTGTSPGPMIAVSSGVALLLLFSGLVYFRRMEKSFADVV